MIVMLYCVMVDVIDVSADLYIILDPAMMRNRPGINGLMRLITQKTMVREPSVYLIGFGCLMIRCSTGCRNFCIPRHIRLLVLILVSMV